MVVATQTRTYLSVDRATATRVARRIAAHASGGGIVLALTGALAISAATHQAPLGGYVERGPSVVAAKPLNVPQWQPQYAKRTGCVRKFADPSRIPDRVLAVNLVGDLVKVPLNTAWRRNADDSAANDLWVVGACR